MYDCKIKYLQAYTFLSNFNISKRLCGLYYEDRGL